MFIAQFQFDPVRLNLPGVFLLQIYQDIPEGAPDPVVVSVPPGAAENALGLGTPDRRIVPHDIQWEYREDPDHLEGSAFDLVRSKLWGTCFFSDVLGVGQRLLLSLDEEPAGFNFGGDELMLAINDSNDITWIGA